MKTFRHAHQYHLFITALSSALFVISCKVAISKCVRSEIRQHKCGYYDCCLVGSEAVLLGREAVLLGREAVLLGREVVLWGREAVLWGR
jgi:hypothetical protein